MGNPACENKIAQAAPVIHISSESLGAAMETE
jgi:hypothetical protein